MAFLTPDEILELLPRSQQRRLRRLPANERLKMLREQQEMFADLAMQNLSRQLPQTELSWRIFQQLLREARTPYESRTNGTLDLTKVAYFLGWIASSPEKDLSWVRSTGLKWLGIAQAKKGQPVGRPKGRKQAQIYYFYFLDALRVIEQDGLWSIKKELMTTHPSDWTTRLKRELKRRGLGNETVSFILSAQSPKSLATYMVSQHLNVSYDAVAKGVQRASRSPNNI